MRELLAVPGWKAPPATLDAWKSAFADLGNVLKVRREDGEVWLDLDGLRMRGYVVLEGTGVTAINFELHATDPQESADLLARAADSLGWELHEEDDDDEEDEPGDGPNSSSFPPSE